MEAQLEGQVLDFVTRNGPSLPVQVSKAIERDMIFAGALLSQLTSKKVLFLSHAKIGGSPLYYAKGQEARLSLLYNHLPLKEKEAYNLLKEKKILMDKVQEPAFRVALRALKDFAVPFQAEVDGKPEWFWKWRTATDQEIANMFGNKEEQVTIPEPAVQYKPVQVQERKVQVQVADNRQVMIVEPELKREQPKIEQKIIKKPKVVQSNEDDFLEDAASFIEDNEMEILDEKVIKKNREIHFTVNVPSNVGDLEYFAVARNKKKINEGDISLAYHEGQKRKLPVLFLSPGELTKKAEKYIDENLKGFVVFMRVE